MNISMLKNAGSGIYSKKKKKDYIGGRVTIHKIEKFTRDLVVERMFVVIHGSEGIQILTKR